MGDGRRLGQADDGWAAAGPGPGAGGAVGVAVVPASCASGARGPVRGIDNVTTSLT